MDQPVPEVSEQDVLQVVRRDFSPDQFEAVIAILRQYGGEQWTRGGHRIRLAILKLADGNLDAVRSQLDDAKRDYRDVLAYAEYPGSMTVVLQSEGTAEADTQEIIHAD